MNRGNNHGTIDDSAAIEAVWKTFNKGLKSFIISKVQDESVADDILQDVFIRIHDKIDTLKDQTKVQSWLYQITRNMVYDHFRGRKNMINEDEELPALDHDTGEEESFMSESIEDMIRMMDKLPPKYCEALCLTELGGMNQIEYSKHIGLSYSAAKSRIQRARTMLRDMMMNCCHYQFDRYGTVIDVHPIRCCCCQHVPD